MIINADTVISDETRSLIENVVREHLDGFNVQPCEIESYENHDGEAAISVGICYLDAAKPISPTTTIKLIADLRGRLVDAGEHRFPYVRHYFHEEQEIVGVAHACGAT